MDYYKILNVSSDASLKEIEQSYKDLSSFYNPENNLSKNAFKRYREVNEAYKVLSEIKQREMYDKLHLKEIKEEEVEKGEYISINFYMNKKNSIEFYDDTFSSVNPKDIHLKVKLSYLYYLVSADYKVSYFKDELTYLDNDCPCCLGKGNVRFNNKVSVCPHCFGNGKDCIRNKVEEYVVVNCNDKNIIVDKDDYKIYIEFDFYDKDYYKEENNEIFVDYIVSQEDYKNGIHFELRKDDFVLNIDSVSFSNVTYTFLDKIIHYNFILDKYAGEDMEAYLISDKNLVYMNLNDFTYKFESDKDHTFKLLVENDTLTLEGLGKKGYNDKNGNLIIHVIRVKNDLDMKLFFNKKIKKVSALLFKLKGSYNNHFFNKEQGYDYDEKYIYLPSRAYKLASKNYFILKIIYSIVFLIVPFVMYLFMGFNMTFIISVLTFALLYLIVVNLLMEVKI